MRKPAALVELNCSNCQKPFQKKETEVNRQKEQGYKSHYCGRKCQQEGATRLRSEARKQRMNKL